MHSEALRFEIIDQIKGPSKKKNKFPHNSPVTPEAANQPTCCIGCLEIRYSGLFINGYFSKAGFLILVPIFMSCTSQFYIKKMLILSFLW